MLQHLQQTQRKKEEGCWIDHDNAQNSFIALKQRISSCAWEKCCHCYDVAKQLEVSSNGNNDGNIVTQ